VVEPISCRCVVVEVYHNTSDRHARLVLLIVQQCGAPEALDFWDRVLASMVDDFWKAALDGVGSLGGESSRRILLPPAQQRIRKQREWMKRRSIRCATLRQSR
jgi:hypothetical protein